MIGSPSGSEEPADEKLTVSGAVPLVLSAAAFAIGDKPSATYSIRYSAEFSSPLNQPVP